MNYFRIILYIEIIKEQYVKISRSVFRLTRLIRRYKYRYFQIGERSKLAELSANFDHIAMRLIKSCPPLTKRKSNYHGEKALRNFLLQNIRRSALIVLKVFLFLSSNDTEKFLLSPPQPNKYPTVEHVRNAVETSLSLVESLC